MQESQNLSFFMVHNMPIILFVVIALDKSQPVCRGTWFTGSTSQDTWQPLSEEDSNQIESSHQTILRSMVSQSALLSWSGKVWI